MIAILGATFLGAPDLACFITAMVDGRSTCRQHHAFCHSFNDSELHSLTLLSYPASRPFCWESPYLGSL